MDELHGFCVRVLGQGEAADAAQRAGRDAAQGDRVRGLAAAAVACREHLSGETREPAVAEARAGEPAAAKREPPHTAEGEPPHAAEGEPPHAAEGEPSSLAETVARELAHATAQLPERQREALALRELVGLSYDELGTVVELDPSAVGPLLARARLRLRVALRGEGVPMPSCDERERALRTIARRQDGESVTEADEDWLIEHLGHCVGCARAHSTMLEASACYRAWRTDDAPGPPVGADAPS
jgi:DNA-directed RNA polymerase specialized sigma24 family protein